MKKIIISLIVFYMSFSGCSSFGVVSMQFSASRQKIWEAMKEVLNEEYTGVAAYDKNPLTIVSKPKKKDTQFEMDKTEYIARLVLSGFSRPYSVDAEVRAYKKGVRSRSYEVDEKLSYKLLVLVKKKIEYKKRSMNLIDDFSPY